MRGQFAAETHVAAPFQALSISAHNVIGTHCFARIGAPRVQDKAFRPYSTDEVYRIARTRRGP